METVSLLPISQLVAGLALALTFGGMTFFSAVLTPLVFSKLPLKVAGPFIRQVFPWYYLTMGVTVLVALAALLLWRFRFPGRSAYEGTVALPIIIPEICMGVAMMAFFSRIGWPSGLPWPINLGAITIAHISFSFPFVAMVVRARLARFNPELEEAARDLGATQWQSFRDILLPYMRPGLIAGALLAFTLSLDDFVITFFTAGPETVTFPVKVYSMIRFSVTPEVNAASTVLIAITLVLTTIALWLQNRTQTRPGESSP